MRTLALARMGWWSDNGDMEAESHRCRICTANDLEALVEETAQAMWEIERPSDPHEVPWADAGGHWQALFRGFATAALGVLRDGERNSVALEIYRAREESA